MPPALLRLVATVTTLVALSLVSRSAAAQSVIRTEGKREHYSVELEPHFVFGWSDPPGNATGDGLGLGLRSTFEISKYGFIKQLNDSVGIGVGLDLVFYDGSGHGPRGTCETSVTIRGGVPVCVRASGSGDDDTTLVWLPVVMQWNFWLHKRWSVFGEPGLALRFDDLGDVGISPFVFFAGGRFHLSYNATLTLRLSVPYAPFGPYAAFGASFMF